MNYYPNKLELEEFGYSILDKIYSDSEIDQLLNCINDAEKEGSSFMKTNDLFAIRQLINVIPELKSILFNPNLKKLVADVAGENCFLTKAIYLDKPSDSNWFVSYHQDLSISVNDKLDLPNYKNWTFKKGQYGVQPPLKVLEDTLTVRIHLDKTDNQNGALKVVPKSHLKGVCRANEINWDKEIEHVCEVEQGGAMLMKPLTMHASNRTTNEKRRRVIHLEFCKHELAEPLKWLERSEIDN
ncbi:MAG: phytanoyl-CoA dioxygenase family protein [Flavobacteriales bacterium]|nr:phytanoyl-CoA dioxygenase family protein [Flavobacteriales bacterium]